LLLFFQNLAAQALRVCLSHSPSHPEALTNLALLDLRAGHVEAARAGLEAACRTAPLSSEPWWNLALLRFKTGELEGAGAALVRVLEAEPEHAGALKLKKTIGNMFLGF